MPIEIKVGPPDITISQGHTFMVTDQRGFIHTSTDEAAATLACDRRPYAGPRTV